MKNESAKHTPGPWRPVYSSMHERTVIATFDQSKDFPSALIAIVNSTLHEIDEAPSETDRANARLIAAAPELLEVCKRNLAISSCDGLTCKANGGSDYCVWCETRAAITKAEGNQAHHGSEVCK